MALLFYVANRFSVEMGGGIEVASHGDILLFNESNLWTAANRICE